MRIVLDSNILARPAFSTSGPAAELLERMTQSGHVLIASRFILDELGRILHYPRLHRLHNLNDAEIAQYVDDIRNAAAIADPSPSEIVPVVKSDADDDHIIATAVVGNAEVLCTWDRHFDGPDVKEYCSQRGIAIMDDFALLQHLRKIEADERGDD